MLPRPPGVLLACVGREHPPARGRAACAHQLLPLLTACSENNTGRFPRGLSLMLRSMAAWIYDR